jgi:hypothetical protein
VEVLFQILRRCWYYWLVSNAPCSLSNDKRPTNSAYTANSSLPRYRSAED